MNKLKFLVPKLVCFQLHTIRYASKMQNVFVYGTLKRGEPNHYWLQDKKNGVGRYVNDGVTKTLYPLIIATKYNIPFLLHAPGSGYNVRGEIFEVNKHMLAKLDLLEDHPNYYVREKDEILVYDINNENPESVQCWVYFLKNFKPELLTRKRYENYSSSGDHGLLYMDRKSSLHEVEEFDDLLDKKKK